MAGADSKNSIAATLHIGVFMGLSGFKGDNGSHATAFQTPRPQKGLVRALASARNPAGT
jgi:hypothetical protein